MKIDVDRHVMDATVHAHQVVGLGHVAAAAPVLVAAVHLVPVQDVTQNHDPNLVIVPSRSKNRVHVHDLTSRSDHVDTNQSLVPVAGLGQEVKMISAVAVEADQVGNNLYSRLINYLNN